MKTLSMQRPFPSIEIRVPTRFSLSVHARDVNWADSTGRRNTFHILFEQPVESLCRCLPRQRFPGARIQRMGYGAQLFGTMLAEIRALWEVLAEQGVGVLVAAALPGALRVTEIDLETSIHPKLHMLGHLGALVPSQRAT